MQVELTRAEYIRLKLKRGDIKKLSRQLNVHHEWVSMVLRGRGISERVLRAAEALISERENQKS
jgi:FAD synthase